MPLIEARNLTKSYSDGTQALRGASFGIEKGEFVAIMGPSGSGKSTLLHILGFLDKQTSGEYVFEGKEVSLYTDDDRAEIRNRKIGFVFQAFHLLSRASVLDNVKLPFVYSNTLKSQRDEPAMRAIEVVGLAHRVEHAPSELSGGEKQRVAIARSLVLNPELVFADEPTGNLDSKSGAAVMEIFDKLHKERKTVIVITHDPKIALHTDRLIRMEDGYVVEDAPTRTSSIS